MATNAHVVSYLDVRRWRKAVRQNVVVVNERIGRVKGSSYSHSIAAKAHSGKNEEEPMPVPLERAHGAFVERWTIRRWTLH